MKKYLLKALILSLITAFALHVSAQSDTSKKSSAGPPRGEPITDQGVYYVVDPENSNVVLKTFAGGSITCGQYTCFLREFVRRTCNGAELETVLEKRDIRTGAHRGILYNTCWIPGKGIVSFRAGSVNKDVLYYENEPVMVVECAQPLSTDAGKVAECLWALYDQNCLKNQNNNNNNTQTNLKNENDMKSTVDTVQHLVSGGVNHFANNPNGDSNDNLAFYAFLAFMVIAALVLIAIMAFRAIRGRDGYSHSHHTISSSAPGSPVANPGYNEDAEKTAFKSIKRAFEIIDEVRENDEAFLKKHKAHGPTEITVIEGEGANKKVTTTKF